MLLKKSCIGSGTFLAWLVINSCLQAADREQRDYVIYVDGKEAGQSSLIIMQQDDGLTYLTANLNVKFQQLVLNYSLGVEAAEWWKEGKLIGLKCQTTENGKKTEIVVSPSGDQLRAKVNGLDRALAAEVWTSSFWKLPDPRYHNKSVPLFEVDTGKDFNAQLQYIGNEQITIMNRPQKCFHFRVTGVPSPTDLWFDQYHRLVRQEFVDTGHKTIVQLTNIRR